MIYDYKGLSDIEIDESRMKHGANVFTPPAKESLWKRFLMTLTGPFGHLIKKGENGDMLVFILECAAILSICISLSEYNGWMGLPVSPDGAKVFFEPAGIIMAILLASGVGFIAEVKAEKEFDVLNQVNDDEPVTVVRNGHPTQVPRKDIVVGDIISLTTGEEIPADAKLLEATSLAVDESTLTGEPFTYKGVSTHQLSSPLKGEGPGEEALIYKGTKVLEGSAIAEVFAVGDSTENGKVFEATKLDDGKKTPLDQQFEYLGYLITAISAVVGVLVLVGRIVFYLHSYGVDTELVRSSYGVPSEFLQGTFLAYFLQSLMIAVTLVVCAVPEGLPMAVTMALAYSMRKMLKSNNLVRKLHACETMGATTVICTDKTGTLTQNKMRVMETTTNDFVYLNMAVNSTAELDGDEVLGNPTEGALLLWLKEKGVDYKELREKSKVTSVEPFSTETKMMKTTLEDGTILIKGAPEYVLQMCPNIENKEEIEAKLKEWQGKAMRTLAFASQDSKLTALHFDGIVGIFDPVREDVPEAIRECQQAGIRIIMVTGDSYNTAHEIGRQIGLENLDTDVISRARPMDKKDLVERLQAEGEVVAVTGDGTNDAPAMKAANVGLSMGSGTSVAKEASDITIIDDAFSSIVNAVIWGRSLYINIQRFILFQLTVNISACLVVMIGSFIAPDSPLTVTQMLWVNLIMDTFAAVALASLPPSKSVMNYPPRKKSDHIIDLPMAVDIIGTGIYFTALLLFLLFQLNQDGDFSLLDKGIFFTSFIFLQLWNLFFARKFRSMGKTKAGMAFWGIAAVIFFGQLIIVNIGYNFFNIAPLNPIALVFTFFMTLIAMLPKAFCKLTIKVGSINYHR